VLGDIHSNNYAETDLHHAREVLPARLHEHRMTTVRADVLGACTRGSPRRPVLAQARSIRMP